MLTSVYFAEQGWNVIATMQARRGTPSNRPANVRVLELDVTNVAQTRASAQLAIEAFGQIDVVVNNAGAGAYGPLELTDEETIDWQSELNLRGSINVIRPFLPYFRSRRAGISINISSYMGVTTAVPTGSLYNMSTFGLEGLTEGLYYELQPPGIELRLIEPGGSRGNSFIKNMRLQSSSNISDYEPLVRKVSKRFESIDEERLDDPQMISGAILSAASGENSQFRALVGKDGSELVAARNAMPIEDYLRMIAERF
jgi:NAD(P)-dependent dehydrogenase (short-subunit alcohol dehydrogenase family)